MKLGKSGRIAVQYCILLFFWLVLSGKWEALYVAIGAIAAGLVTFLNFETLHSEESLAKAKQLDIRFLLTSGWRLFAYSAWLLLDIVKSNIQVAFLVLHPRMPIRPGLLQFRTRLRSDLGQIILANSITLTPGTMTLELHEGTYLVHALVPEAAQNLLEVKMQNKLEAIFGEKEEPVPEIRWVEEKRVGR